MATQTDINFYQIDGDEMGNPLAKSVAPLLLKILAEKESALIFSTNETTTKALDDSLWSYGRNKFIPHITIADQEFTKEFPIERQPILITNQESNNNKAQHLIFVDECSEAFISGFSRAFYFYDSWNLDKAKNLAKKLRNVASKINSYKKENGKWVGLSLA